jgi:hypothetical protein
MKPEGSALVELPLLGGDGLHNGIQDDNRSLESNAV